jgi:Protein of unknown function (DUF2568)
MVPVPAEMPPGRPLVGALLGLRFVVELGAYAALGYWGAAGAGSMTHRVSSAVLAPLAAIVVWSLLLAPKARWHLGEPAALLLEVVVFATAALALAWRGPVVIAVVLGVGALSDALLLRLSGSTAHETGAAGPAPGLAAGSR